MKRFGVGFWLGLIITVFGQALFGVGAGTLNSFVSIAGGVIIGIGYCIGYHAGSLESESTK